MFLSGGYYLYYCVCDTAILPWLQMLRPVQMSEETMQAFHTKEYIDFLKNVTPENQASVVIFHE